MYAFICLFFPPIISVWLYLYLKKEKQKPIQMGLQYILAAVIVNALCFLIKCVWMKGGMGYIHFMLTDIPLFSAAKFLAMAAAISVAYAFCLYGLRSYCLPYIQRSALWLFIKRQFEVMTVRKVLGFSLGVCFLLIFSVVYENYRLAILYFLLFTFSGFLRCRPVQDCWKYTILAVYTAVVIGILLFFPYYELFALKNWSYYEDFLSVSAIAYSGLLVLLFVALINGMIGNWRSSLTAASVVLSTLTVLNGYIYRFRGKEFIFPDIFSAVTAGNVAQNYDLSLQHHTFTVLSLLALVTFLGYAVEIKMPKRKCCGRVLSLAASAVLLFVFLLGTKDMRTTTWNHNGTLVNGYYLNFYLSAKDYFVKKPEQYSDAYIKALEEEYRIGEGGDLSPKPNILVVMSESYADFNVLGSNMSTNVPVTPFWDSLTENTIKGYALASVFGGTTANSEFEFLTGFSMHFLPDGATPYQQYIYDDTFSLAQLLNSYGYRCVSTHPYRASGWNRPATYPRLGFEESTFEEAYPHEKLIRSYVSDREMFEYLLGVLKEEKDQPLFLFGITMQNHGGYNGGYDDFAQPIVLEGYQQSYPSAEMYLSLLRESDAALEYLLTELAELEEDTIVLFFGDHFPQLEQAFFEELHGGGFETLDSKMKQFMVPFLIWANFDIAEQAVECTSLSYLAPYLLESAGLELPPYYKFLQEMEQHIPAINGMGYYSNEAKGYLDSREIYPEEAAWLEKYEVLQYNGLHEKGESSSVFFQNYIHKES